MGSGIYIFYAIFTTFLFGWVFFPFITCQLTLTTSISSLPLKNMCAMEWTLELPSYLVWDDSTEKKVDQENRLSKAPTIGTLTSERWMLTLLGTKQPLQNILKTTGRAGLSDLIKIVFFYLPCSKKYCMFSWCDVHVIVPAQQLSPLFLAVDNVQGKLRSVSYIVIAWPQTLNTGWSHTKKHTVWEKEICGACTVFKGVNPTWLVRVSGAHITFQELNELASGCETNQPNSCQNVNLFGTFLKNKSKRHFKHNGLQLQFEQKALMYSVCMQFKCCWSCF